MLTDNSIEQFFTLPKTAFLSPTAYSEIEPDTRTIRTEIEYNQFLESLLRKYGDETFLDETFLDETFLDETFLDETFLDETFLKDDGMPIFGSSDKMICKSLLD